jgi:hypothetical protein
MLAPDRQKSAECQPLNSNPNRMTTICSHYSIGQAELAAIIRAP